MRARWVPVALVAAVALAGCTGDDAADSDDTRAGQTAAPGASPAASAPPAAPVTGIVAGRTIDDSDGRKITVTPVTLKRQGKLTLLEVAARNEDPAERANIADSLRGSGATFDEVTLVDPANGKRYIVARDSENRCLCTSFVGGVTVQPGGTAILGAYFAAPPENVTSLNVTMPGAGTFTGVPVS